MLKFLRLIFANSLFLLMYQIGYADPWFTGPLLAFPGQTIPRGHINVSLNPANNQSDAVYNNKRKKESISRMNSSLIYSQFAYGLTDHLDLQLNGIYSINQTARASHEHIGDTSLMLGYQAFTQSNLLPNLRITLQEIIPTGKYTNLNPAKDGTDVTGLGSYQTGLGFNFQYLANIKDGHYLNTYLNLSYMHADSVFTNGANVREGNSLTRAILNPGNSITLDLAEEFTLTQNWVAVLEGNYIYQLASTFQSTTLEFSPTAIQEISLIRLPLRSSRGINMNAGEQISLAPALEYNFSVNFGIIAGVWFTVAGKNLPEFASAMVLVNANW